MSWLQRFRPTYVPSEAQRLRRKVLAEAIRLWLSREEELSEFSVLMETMTGAWMHELDMPSDEDRYDKDFCDARHHLEHFFSDGDIRKINLAYAEKQRAALKKYVDKFEV